MSRIRKIPVPVYTDLQEKISEMVIRSNQLLNDANEEYILAQNLISKVLGVKVDSCPPIAIKPYSNSFLSSGRLDAEYYQIKYESIEKRLKIAGDVVTTCKIYDNNFIPENNKSYQYIELANVDLMGGVSVSNEIYGDDLPTRARRLVKNGQVIISSIEGSLQSCALITEEYNKAVCSTGFYVIDSEQYNSETLLVLFKSEAIQALLKKRCSGTILTAISKEEFEKMPLPEVDEITQNAIKEKVQDSFKLRKKSKELLDIAIKAVEMAIETGETSALLWLEVQNI